MVKRLAIVLTLHQKDDIAHLKSPSILEEAINCLQQLEGEALGEKARDDVNQIVESITHEDFDQDFAKKSLDKRVCQLAQVILMHITPDTLYHITTPDKGEVQGGTQADPPRSLQEKEEQKEQKEIPASIRASDKKDAQLNEQTQEDVPNGGQQPVCMEATRLGGVSVVEQHAPQPKKEVETSSTSCSIQ